GTANKLWGWQPRSRLCPGRSCHSATVPRATPCPSTVLLQSGFVGEPLLGVVDKQLGCEWRSTQYCKGSLCLRVKSLSQSFGRVPRSETKAKGGTEKQCLLSCARSAKRGGHMAQFVLSPEVEEELTA